MIDLNQANGSVINVVDERKENERANNNYKKTSNKMVKMNVAIFTNRSKLKKIRN